MLLEVVDEPVDLCHGGLPRIVRWFKGSKIQNQIIKLAKQLTMVVRCLSPHRLNLKT